MPTYSSALRISPTTGNYANCNICNFDIYFLTLLCQFSDSSILRKPTSDLCTHINTKKEDSLVNLLSSGLGTNKFCRWRSIFLAYLCGSATTGGGRAGGVGCAAGVGASSGVNQAHATRTQSRTALCSLSGSDKPYLITSRTHSTFKDVDFNFYFMFQICFLRKFIHITYV